MNYEKYFRIRPGRKVRLSEIDTGFTGPPGGRKKAAGDIEHYRRKLCELQELLYADRRHSLLICLQGMDAGGKDGTINHVLGAMNPQGCRVVGFKQPTPEELSHDFLWRIHRAAPARGEVVVFNRSHYEDVLIARVHNLVPKEVWSRRYDAINNFEKELTDSGVHIIKFYLHISKHEQLKRFHDRLDDPARQWKISDADYTERPFWKEYAKAYEEALSRCSTAWAPWYVIPADHKWFRNLAVGQIVVDHLKALKMTFPRPTVNIAQIRRKYHAQNAKQRS